MKNLTRKQLFKRIIEMFDLRIKVHSQSFDLKALLELCELKREVVNVLYEINKLLI